MGINVQICWEKFANYWDVEMRLVPDGGRPLHALGRGGGQALRREHDRRRRRSSARRSTGRTSRSQEICAALDDLQERTGLDIPVHVDGASGAFVAPFLDPDLVWDFRLPRVASINASGHKYGLVYPGVGWIVWRDASALPEELIFWVNYLGDNMPTFALNFSRPGAQVVAQYYNFLRLGFDGYRAVQQYSRDVATRLSSKIAELGPFELLTRGRRAAGVRVQAQGRDRQLHRVRRLERAPGARLAGAGLHLPREPHRPRRASGRRPAAGSRTTSPTCSSRTSSASCRGWRSRPSRCTAPRSRRSTTENAARARVRAGVTSAGAYVALPEGSAVVAADGPGPVHHPRPLPACRRQPARVVVEGSIASTAAARAPVWIAVLFMVGSACFAVGSVAGYSSLVGARADAVTYFAGSLFFTSAAYLQYVECISAPTDVGGCLAHADLRARDPAHRLVGVGRAARRHVVLQPDDVLRARLGALGRRARTSSSGRRTRSARSAS